MPGSTLLELCCYCSVTCGVHSAEQLIAEPAMYQALGTWNSLQPRLYSWLQQQSPLLHIFSPGCCCQACAVLRLVSAHLVFDVTGVESGLKPLDPQDQDIDKPRGSTAEQEESVYNFIDQHACLLRMHPLTLTFSTPGAGLFRPSCCQLATPFHLHGQYSLHSQQSAPDTCSLSLSDPIHGPAHLHQRWGPARVCSTAEEICQLDLQCHSPWDTSRHTSTDQAASILLPSGLWSSVIPQAGHTSQKPSM